MKKVQSIRNVWIFIDSTGINSILKIVLTYLAYWFISEGTL